MNSRNEGLGALLSRHRKACGLSQQHVADTLLVSVRSVKAWESGTKIPRPRRLEYLFQYLEFTLRDIIDARRASMGLPRRRLPPPDLNPFGDSN